MSDSRGGTIVIENPKYRPQRSVSFSMKAVLEGIGDRALQVLGFLGVPGIRVSDSLGRLGVAIVRLRVGRYLVGEDGRAIIGAMGYGRLNTATQNAMVGLGVLAVAAGVGLAVLAPRLRRWLERLSGRDGSMVAALALLVSLLVVI